MFKMHYGSIHGTLSICCIFVSTSVSPLHKHTHTQKVICGEKISESGTVYTNLMQSEMCCMSMINRISEAPLIGRYQGENKAQFIGWTPLCKKNHTTFICLLNLYPIYELDVWAFLFLKYLLEIEIIKYSEAFHETDMIQNIILFHY